MKFFITLAFFAAIAFADVPKMIQKKHWRSLILYSVFFLSVFILGILIAFDVKIPSPIKAIQSFYQSIHLSFQ